MTHATPTALRDYQAQFARHLRDPQANPPPAGVPTDRIDLYVELVYGKLEDSLSACFPLVREVLGDTAWHGLVRDFIARHHCVSPLFRQVPDEFAAYLRGGRTEPGDPPFLAELAHYEWLELFLAVAEAPDPAAFDPEGDVMADIPVFAPTATLARYRYPVHRLGSKPRPRNQILAPDAEPFFILGFRDADGEVNFVEVSTATTRLLELLWTGDKSGRTALAELAEALGHPDCTALSAFGAEILWNLKRQGALLGTRPAPSRSSP